MVIRYVGELIRRYNIIYQTNHLKELSDQILYLFLIVGIINYSIDE